jgi:hypothetical protein
LMSKLLEVKQDPRNVIKVAEYDGGHKVCKIESRVVYKCSYWS